MPCLDLELEVRALQRSDDLSGATVVVVFSLLLSSTVRLCLGGNRNRSSAGVLGLLRLEMGRFLHIALLHQRTEGRRRCTTVHAS